jgi:hypothetical protein
VDGIDDPSAVPPPGTAADIEEPLADLDYVTVGESASDHPLARPATQHPDTYDAPIGPHTPAVLHVTPDGGAPTWGRQHDRPAATDHATDDARDSRKSSR